MDIFASIAERKISEAIRRGELDDLSLKGQPIRVEDLSDVPAELRMGYKILKNADLLPAELQLNREILTLKELIDCCRQPAERQGLKKKLSEKLLRYNILMEKNFKKPLYQQYEARIIEKLGL